MQKYFITTAIDYPNALPHNGTAFEKVGADVQARFRRLCGFTPFLLMGNDENTVKVLKATPEGQTPKQYVDGMAQKFKGVWDSLSVYYNDFIQTTEGRHKAGVQKFIQTVYEAGYIDKRPYTAPYCEGCEEFKTLKSLVDGKCPNHPTGTVHEVTEQNYFFRLSAFRDRLLKYYETADIRPESRKNEIRKFVETELDDISISRVNQNWGILVPWDESQSIYVWFDALLNYLTGIGFGTNEDKFNMWWPADVHVIGKDITRFHCALWPAMIMAYNEKAEKPIALPKMVFAHGFVMRKKDGELVKESKSNPGDVALPTLIDQYGGEAWRYYFMSRCPFDGDGEYDADHFKEIYNADLANNLGNLISRVTNMIVQYGDGKVPVTNKGEPWIDPTTLNDFRDYMGNWNYRAALGTIWKLLNRVNEFIENRKPWKQAKEDKAACLDTLRSAAAALRIVSLMLRPFMPKTAETIWLVFNFDKGMGDSRNLTFGRLAELGFDNYHCLGEITTQKIQPLFPRK